MDLVINGTEYYVPKKWNEINLKRYISFITTYSDEVTYVEKGFNPNLSELKLKEFVDLDNRLENGWQDMHRVMAILYRPIVKRHKEKYEIEEYDFRTAAKRGDIFLEELSVDIVNAAASFFLSIVMDYIKITAAYSKADRKTKRGALRQMKKVLTSGTGGTE